MFPKLELPISISYNEGMNEKKQKDHPQEAIEENAHLKTLGDFFSLLLRIDRRLEEQKKDADQKSRDCPHPAS